LWSITGYLINIIPLSRPCHIYINLSVDKCKHHELIKLCFYLCSVDINNINIYGSFFKQGLFCFGKSGCNCHTNMLQYMLQSQSPTVALF
jgi:hypothetical protein